MCVLGGLKSIGMGLGQGGAPININQLQQSEYMQSVFSSNNFQSCRVIGVKYQNLFSHH